jgi:hypothetical protein
MFNGGALVGQADVPEQQRAINLPGRRPLLTATVVNGDESKSGFLPRPASRAASSPSRRAATTDATPTIFGLATLGTTVSIIRNGTTIATGIPVDGAGAWSYSNLTVLGAGFYTFQVTGSDGGSDASITIAGECPDRGDRRSDLLSRTEGDDTIRPGGATPSTARR